MKPVVKSVLASRCKVYDKFYEKEEITEMYKDNKNILFVFGDNERCVGYGGQAIIRDLPCSYGISTKLSPSTDEESFLSDTDPSHFFHFYEDIVDLVLRMVVDPELVVYFPESGLGTGISEMPKRCPQNFKDLNELLFTYFGIWFNEETKKFE